ncbi:YfhO family protein [candidate division KSB1 bacterium]|nr:YfhO family protein [candidate division KSB1 bacterium]
MASKKKQKPAAKGSIYIKPKTSTALPDWITKRPWLWVTIIVAVLLVILYYQVLLGGKEFLGGDLLKATKCYEPFVDNAFEKGIYPLWNPYIFSGMPAFASLSITPWVNFVDKIINVTLNATGNEFLRIWINYVLFGLLTFILLRHYKIKTEAALFAAVAIAFMPQFVAFGVHGHNTKLLSLVLIPLILYLVDQLIKKQNLIYLALTALTLGFQLFRAHVQVCFYTYLLIGFYFLFYIYDEYKNTKKISTILQSAALLVGAGILALGLSSIIYLSVYEYSHYSIRGGGASGGLDYNYATGWSFSPIEMLTFFVPSFVGFGGATYWGPMGFTDYPLYMSVIVLYLAGMALVLYRNRLTWFFTFIASISLLVSFGNHFPILYKPMFEWIPFFNSFRIPSMIHILLDISILILAAMGLHGLLQLDTPDSEGQKKQKWLLNYTYIFGGFCVLLFLFLLSGESNYHHFAASTESYQQSISMKTQQGYDVDRLLRETYQMAKGDAFKMIFLLGAAIAAIFGYLRKKLGSLSFISAMIALVVIDFWWIDFKIIDHKLEENLRSRIINPEIYFQPTKAVRYLKEREQQEVFRIFAVTKDPNWYMYHEIQSIYGYNPAKIRIYQDILAENLHLNPKILSMLNTRFLISDRGTLPGYNQVRGFERDTEKLFESSAAMPRAYFVSQDTVIEPNQSLASPKERYETHRTEILNFLQSPAFSPEKIAVLEEAPPFTPGPADSNNVVIKSYDIHKIELETQVKNPALMVLSEIYYPAGWKAYINGEETKIYKTNYILRSIFLPPGTHKVEFIFAPVTFKLGFWISLSVLIILLGTIAIQIFIRRKSQIQTN